MSFVYILECSDGSYYTGSTKDLENRLIMHNSGKGAKYTKTRRPVRVIYYEKYDNHSDALRREIKIKKMTRKMKENLIEGKIN